MESSTEPHRSPEKTMQNSAVYRPSFNSAAVTTPANTPWMPHTLRTLAHRWDMAGVLVLMAASAAYGACALAGTGF